MNLETEIRTLKLRMAAQFLSIEMLSTVNEQVYTKFGKLAAEIMLKEKQLLRETENDLQ